MDNALVGSVVEVYVKLLPVGIKSVRIYRKIVVLTGDEAPICAQHADRLIMPVMTVFEFVDVCASCFSH